uniref:Uncharacterized protein n=1 Tax=Fundulus heteroclitus TaxID=8078 RepID=A0A3Q2QGV7_FUNHE
MSATLNHSLLSCWELHQGLQEPSVWYIRVIYASTPSNSGGSGDLGCLLSKCCLKVFGSGIWDCGGDIQKLQGFKGKVSQMPDPKTFKQHFESKHPKSPLPPELEGVEA